MVDMLPDIQAPKADEHFRPNVDLVPTNEATPRYKQLSRDAASLTLEVTGLRKESVTDSLTGLSNEKAYDLALDGVIERERQSGRKQGDESDIALLEIDVDDFKKVNDKLGHAEGDKQLKVVASILQGILRETDMPTRVGEDEQAQASRPHGDEFRVLVRNIKASTQSEMPNTKRLEALTERLRSAASEKGISLSIGGTFYKHGESIEDFQARADAAMYADKRVRKATA